MEKINNTTLIDTYNREEEDFFEGFVDYIEGCTDGYVDGEGTDMEGVWDDGEVFETFWDWYYRECECIEEDFLEWFSWSTRAASDKMCCEWLSWSLEW